MKLSFSRWDRLFRIHLEAENMEDAAFAVDLAKNCKKDKCEIMTWFSDKGGFTVDIDVHRRADSSRMIKRGR